MQSTQSTPEELEPIEFEDGGRVERIDKKDIKPVNDPKCKHEFIEDPEDQTDFYIAMTCTKCPVGYLRPKKV